MKTSKQSYKPTIYDMAFNEKSFFPKLSNEQSITNALTNSFYYFDYEELIDLIGINPYLDVFSFEEKNLNSKLNYLTPEEIFDKYKIIADKIREEYFPNSGLESTIIAHGMEYVFNPLKLN